MLFSLYLAPYRAKPKQGRNQNTMKMADTSQTAVRRKQTATLSMVGPPARYCRSQSREDNVPRQRSAALSGGSRDGNPASLLPNKAFSHERGPLGRTRRPYITVPAVLRKTHRRAIDDLHAYYPRSLPLIPPVAQCCSPPSWVPRQGRCVSRRKQCARLVSGWRNPGFLQLSDGRG